MAAISSTFDNINFSLNWDQVETEETEEEEAEDKYVMGLLAAKVKKKKKKAAKGELNPLVDD